MDISKQAFIGERQTAEAKATKSKANGSMDMDDFMKIMAATISNPSMSGGDSENPADFMMQMATFTQMEQMSDMSDVLGATMMMVQQQQAISLSGKTVTLLSDGAERVEGIVEKVKFGNGYATIQVNGKDYNLSDIVEMGEIGE